MNNKYDNPIHTGRIIFIAQGNGMTYREGLKLVIKVTGKRVKVKSILSNGQLGLTKYSVPFSDCISTSMVWISE